MLKEEVAQQTLQIALFKEHHDSQSDPVSIATVCIKESHVKSFSGESQNADVELEDWIECVNRGYLKIKQTFW